MSRAHALHILVKTEAEASDLKGRSRLAKSSATSHVSTHSARQARKAAISVNSVADKWYPPSIKLCSANPLWKYTAP